jgi:hypothetical protein
MAEAFDVQVDYSKIKVKLDELPPALRARLKTTAQALAAELRDVATIRAKSDIWVRTGAYLRGMRTSVRSSKNSVTGTLKNRAKIAAIIEYGATRPAHDIMPNVAKALHFMSDAGEVFAAHVHNPGSTTKDYRILHGALADMEGTIVSEMTGTVRDVTADINAR